MTTWLKEKFPLIGFAIANSLFIELADSSDTIIISILLFISGYIIFRMNDIFGFAVDGFVSLDCIFFIATILGLNVYATAITVINTGFTAFIPLAIVNIVSGYFAAYTKYSYFNDDTYEELVSGENNTEDDGSQTDDDDNK